MQQMTFLKIGPAVVQYMMPPEEDEVLPDVHWGNVGGFPSVAYWSHKIMERRVSNQPLNYKLGRTLLEEVFACLLGGFGIPASVGLAAYEHMKSKGAASGQIYSETELYMWLSEPILHRGKLIKYRFAKQKSKYLSNAINYLANGVPVVSCGRELRDWLMGINGIGPKTASWIVRNWMDADDVAILDIHIYRAGLLAGFFESDLTVEKNYLELERRFVELAIAMGVRASELDAVMWYEMQNSPFVLSMLNEAC